MCGQEKRRNQICSPKTTGMGTLGTDATGGGGGAVGIGFMKKLNFILRENLHPLLRHGSSRFNRIVLIKLFGRRTLNKRSPEWEEGKEACRLTGG